MGPDDGDGDAPAAVDGCALVIDGQSFLYLAVSHLPAGSSRGLTDAEREVARRAALGESTQDNAAARRTSTRTVDNQLASIFRKLGIASRSELCATVFGADGPSEPV